MVTVIIPTYKRPNFIERAINSALNQTYSDLEVIVVDDNDSASEERKLMKKIMAKYSNDSRVTYIKHLKNMNGATARNTGIEVARGEYITFLDDDDFFLKSRIKELVDCLELNKDYDGAYTGGIIIYQNEIIDTFSPNYDGNFQLEILKQKPILKTGSNIFFRTKILKELNGFDTEFMRHQDLELMVRFFRNHKIKALNSHTVVKDETSRINTPNIEKAIQMKEFYLKKFQNDIDKYENNNQIYVENYKSLLLKCNRKNKEYNYIEKKLKLYNYKKITLLKLKMNIKKTIIASLYYRFKKKYKIQKIDKYIINEVLNIISNS